MYLKPRLIAEDRYANGQHENISSQKEEDWVDNAHETIWMHSLIHLSIPLLEVFFCHSPKIEWIEYRYKDWQENQCKSQEYRQAHIDASE